MPPAKSPLRCYQSCTLSLELMIDPSQEPAGREQIWIKRRKKLEYLEDGNTFVWEPDKMNKSKHLYSMRYVPGTVLSN